MQDNMRCQIKTQEDEKLQLELEITRNVHYEREIMRNFC